MNKKLLASVLILTLAGSTCHGMDQDENSPRLNEMEEGTWGNSPLPCQTASNSPNNIPREHSRNDGEEMSSIYLENGAGHKPELIQRILRSNPTLKARLQEEDEEWYPTRRKTKLTPGASSSGAGARTSRMLPQVELAKLIAQELQTERDDMETQKNGAIGEKNVATAKQKSTSGTLKKVVIFGVIALTTFPTITGLFIPGVNCPSDNDNNAANAQINELRATLEALQEQIAAGAAT